MSAREKEDKMFKKYIISWHLEENDAPVCMAQTRNETFANLLAKRRSKEFGAAKIVVKPLFGRPTVALFENGEPVGVLIN
jgi:hypothetical protein